MGLGVLEDHQLEHVPGTAPLNELGREVYNTSGVDSSILKHDPAGEIVLIPQPSDSPNDPYNWPRWKKERFTITYGFACGAVGAVGPLLGPAFVELAAEFNVPLATFIQGVQGGLIVAIAFGSLICNSLAVKFGKRPIYLFTTLMLMVTCFWCAAAKTFVSLVAARVVQGFCMGPLEALIPASISDVWFVHERGYRSAVFNLGVLGGINLAQPVAGYIIQYSGYKTAFYAMGGAFGIALIMIFFWMPETAFIRTGAVNLDTSSKNIMTELKITHKMAVEHIEGEKIDSGQSIETPEQTPAQEEPYSYARDLRLYSGYINHVSFFNTLFRPFMMLGSPAVLWATLLFTTCISWLVGISVTLSQIFSAPPYNFSVSVVGLTNLSSFVATILGTLVAGPLIDGVVRKMSKRNGGTFEPEFRLPIMVSYLLFTATGFFAWGQAAYAQDPWEVPVIVGLGLINFGIQLGTTGVVSYIVDCHREKASEAFATMNFIKNMFAFGLTNYLNNWIATQGVRNVFFTMGGLTIGVSLFTIPMYIYGKRARSWVYRHNVAGNA
ncbi:major facilitator superfamily domain-containing protein [Dendryphion nanum]|uniref:Major facilitator superfamily domain-containing protein n=1 Tax=Dendryphion nanum TaxID=256645 RepID=A0A9P9IPB8_9PLEO|nr:major facilitator superfamily domain-containing protein [Dendryphion nanum]